MTLTWRTSTNLRITRMSQAFYILHFNFHFALPILLFPPSPHALIRGSQNLQTLAIAGAKKVPLIEGHADTRSRWSANLFTWSNVDRLMTELPGCELMFKADGHELELRLRAHIRGRGYGHWLTVCTSPKASYREEHVLNFLEAHLPQQTGGPTMADHVCGRFRGAQNRCR